MGSVPQPGEGVCRVYGICQSDQGIAELNSLRGLPGHPGDSVVQGLLGRGGSGGCQGTQEWWLVHGVSLDGVGPPHSQGPGARSTTPFLVPSLWLGPGEV